MVVLPAMARRPGVTMNSSPEGVANDLIRRLIAKCCTSKEVSYKNNDALYLSDDNTSITKTREESYKGNNTSLI